MAWFIQIINIKEVKQNANIRKCNKKEQEAYEEYNKWSEDVEELYHKTGKHEDFRTARILSAIASDEKKHQLWLQNILWRLQKGYAK